MDCKRQKLGDSNCLSKTFESVQVEYRWVLKRIRDEIQVIDNLSISGDTVVMENLCRIMSDILMFINDNVILQW